MKVWLDDIREIPKDYTHWVKTAEEAITLLKTGEVTEISLDHDLGNEVLTGYDVAKFIEESAVKGKLKRLRIRIHSQNPIGRENIKMALRIAHKSWMDEEAASEENS